ncbi:aldo/keto reductase [Mycena olivaceomarginata]|nr:aldo/keto reductase [Mycena olivaceomarginata]
MVQRTTKLGGTASDTTVGGVAHGLMMMTWTPTPAPDAQCFAAIKAGVDALPAGAKMFLNSAKFYAMDMGTANLEMLARFYARYPEYADRTFLSVKGAVRDRAPDNSPASLRASVSVIQRALGPHKTLDLFQPARIDRAVPIEETMHTLAALVAEGQFAHVGLSECSAATLRRAHAVYPVTAVEIEVSPFSYEAEQRRVIAAAAELGVSVVAYSPLGRGFLSWEDQEWCGYAGCAACHFILFSSSRCLLNPQTVDGDIRSRYTRFKDENLKANLPVVEALEAMAKRKGITVAQLCIAWVAAQGAHVIPLPGSSKATRTLENLEGGDVVLDAGEVEELSGIVAKHGVKGDRGMGLTEEEQHYWG